PTKTVGKSITLLSAEAFVVSGQWTIKAPADGPEGPLEVRVELPAAAATLEKLNKSIPPDEGGAVLRGEPPIVLSVRAFSQERWWVTSIGTGAAVLLGIVLLMAFVGAAMWQAVTSKAGGEGSVSDVVFWVALGEIGVIAISGYHALALLDA